MQTYTSEWFLNPTLSSTSCNKIQQTKLKVGRPDKISSNRKKPVFEAPMIV